MDAKQEAKRKVDAASSGCDKVQNHWHAAYSALNRGTGVNGYGIYHDCSAVRSSLLEAKASIESALRELEAIVLPTDNDYDQF